MLQRGGGGIGVRAWSRVKHPQIGSLRCNRTSGIHSVLNFVRGQIIVELTKTELNQARVGVSKALGELVQNDQRERQSPRQSCKQERNETADEDKQFRRPWISPGVQGLDLQAGDGSNQHGQQALPSTSHLHDDFIPGLYVGLGSA
jgi:hypothetical protein